MPIDDPLAAIEQLNESDLRTSSPVTQCVAGLVSYLPLPSLTDKVVDYFVGRLEGSRDEKIQLTIDVITTELQYLQNRLRELGEKSDEKSVVSWLELVMDGLRKAEQTRAKERVKRIGRILANSIAAVPSPSDDDVEEMMRVAMLLSDSEVKALSALVNLQGHMLTDRGKVNRSQGWRSWPQGGWPEIADGDFESTFSKLESLGLVLRIAPPNNVNINADFQNRYGILRKGRDFITFIKSNC
jgi:hypothetical protein